MRHLALRRAVIATCQEMNRLGINQGRSGNVSVRVPEGFLVTGSGIPYEAMQPRHIVEMDLDGGYRGEVLPSSEWRMHLDLMRTRADAQAVVHTHSTHATALSCLRLGIPAFHYMVAVAGGADISCADYATFGTAALSRQMLAAMEGRAACLLANHGVVAIGRSLEDALARAVEVETLAKQYWIARTLGQPVVLDEAEMARVLARFRSYGQQRRENDPAAIEMPEQRDQPRRANRRTTRARPR
ncbi:class II aldolase/adducin family protein [Elioraea sp.]|uniref:class II aldolase/adducin family protein n=1 Tax=Elioraea sp. TaxID=2185103 RepID=UPI003F6F9806